LFAVVCEISGDMGHTHVLFKQQNENPALRGTFGYVLILGFKRSGFIEHEDRF